MAVYLGIDAGTTSLKAAVFDQSGRMLSISRQEYDLLTPQPSWVELDAETYWQACCQAVRQAVAASHVKAGEIVSLCISSQGETLIPLNGQGQPTRRAIVWLDNRAVQEAAFIASQFDAQELYHITGQPEVTATWPACKLLWMRNHEPQVFSRTAKFLLLEDYLLYRLTGQFVCESALQTSSLLVDINKKEWWQPMFDLLQVTSDHFGRLLHPGDLVGSLSTTGAQALGLTTRSVAVCGAMDQSLGALGAGNFLPGVVSETTGGALGIVASLNQPKFDPQRRIPCHCHIGRQSYCLLPWGQTAGMALRWFRDQFYAPEVQSAAQAGADAYDWMTAEAARVPPGAEGLVVLPHLEGAACPEFNPRARAVFFGATLRHTRAHFVRGILEAVAYMLRKNLEIVESLGVSVSEVRSMGGGARSRLWLQIKADMLQKPVACLETEESALLGAAILGAAATGGYASLEEAAAQMARVKERIEPNPANQQVYDQGYAAYLKLYKCLYELF